MNVQFASNGNKIDIDQIYYELTHLLHIPMGKKGCKLKGPQWVDHKFVKLGKARNT